MARVLVEYDSTVEEDASKHMRGLREGMRAAAEQWQREMAPKHFTAAAQYRYGYRRRTKRYQDRKERRFGHRLPLVWTGETRRWVTTRFAKARIRKASGGFSARLLIATPGYFFKFKPGTQTDKVQELTSTRSDEAKRLERVIDEKVREALARRRGRKRREI